MKEKIVFTPTFGKRKIFLVLILFKKFIIHSKSV